MNDRVDHINHEHVLLTKSVSVISHLTQKLLFAQFTL